MLKTVKRMLWRGGVSMLLAATAACIHMATLSLREAFYGVIVLPFVLPSVIAFLLFEHICTSSYPKYLGFFIPSMGCLGYGIYTLWKFTPDQISDASDLMLKFLLETYGIGLGFAFIALIIINYWINQSSSKTHPNQFS